MFTIPSKLFPLSGGPLSPLNHRPSTLRLSHHHILHLSRSNSHFPIKFSQQFRSRSTGNTPENNGDFSADVEVVTSSHPWPEWSELLGYASSSGQFETDRNIKDEFVPNESLSMEFVDAACSFLGFANDRDDMLGWLPKDDIQVLVNDGTPFLFKNAVETEKRMRSFLQGEESSEATTLDLMKYILSYASNPIFYPERNIKEATELSARNLLREMANFNGRGKDDQTSTSLGPDTNIKRGDWICQKCSFMNVATNTKCLECEELRPQRRLTGNEWDCPKCNFFNHGRNKACLKCECRRPGEVPLPVTQVKNYGYAPFVPLPDDMFSKKSENIKTRNSEPKINVSETNSEKSVTKIENQIKDTAEDEKSERWFNKVAELHDVTDLTSVISDDDFPEIMPMRKGENRFVVSKKKDRSLNSPTYKRQQAIEQEKNTSFVPFVPFPPDYFAKKDDNQVNSGDPNSENGFQGLSPLKETDPLNMSEEAKASNSTNSSQMPHENLIKAANDADLVQKTTNTPINRSANRPETLNGDRVKSEDPNLRNGFQRPSLEGSAVKETDPLDMSEEAKAERWFRRVAQIKDISELSQIPDEDFPSIMPMRKGVNRFVVSKRKTPLERRLSSVEHKKNIRTVRSEPSKKDGDDS
ncbi:putative Zinc finger, RanBP2-type [Helianthus annuus]|uniref:Zinc finger, RanBP2-type n=1 Tax=Helianthus annuus TaxID=4232 RepID=A0A9K3NEG6_HELAN|nr:zinc finger protein VAR3, chloroplastic [Helianthus annuus]KAF5796403.1 putative Zinc finger, RanBP2-type [Helianthus annuus]